MLTDASTDPHNDEGGLPLAGRLAAWLQPRPGELIGLVVLVVGAVVATLLWWQQAATGPAGIAEVAAAGVAIDVEGVAAGPARGVEEEDPGAVPRVDGEVLARVTVHVTGAVRTPGLVTLPADARVGDAVLAAGGLAADADPTRANLARIVADGEQVHVPAVGEGPLVPPPGSGQDAEDPADGRPIDLNTADAAMLESLPGIGPARAAAIIEHRARHGPFAVPGDLRDVSGIGEQTFQRLAPDLVVR
ncbi:MAG: helix-hairpin-helix domain-containing protein [Nitriliruptoraceae bacterium]